MAKKPQAAQKAATPTADAATPPATNPADEKNSAAVSLYGSSILPSTIEIGDASVSLGEIVQAAFSASNLTAEAWNELPADEREALLQAEVDRRVAATPPTPPNPADLPERVTLKRPYGFYDDAGAMQYWHPGVIEDPAAIAVLIERGAEIDIPE